MSVEEKSKRLLLVAYAGFLDKLPPQPSAGF